MPIALGIGTAVAGVGTGILGYFGAQKAASTQANAAKDIAAQQMQVNQQAFAPWMAQGQQAWQSLGSLYGLNGDQGIKDSWAKMLDTPAYKFAVSQGNLGLDRTAASRGLLLSGGQLKDAMSFNQGLGTQQVGNYTNVLQSMSDLGLRASAGFSGQFNQAANTMMGGANAQAAGTIGGINALGAGINSGANNSLLAYGLSKFAPGNNSSTTSSPSSYNWGSSSNGSIPYLDNPFSGGAGYAPSTAPLTS